MTDKIAFKVGVVSAIMMILIAALLIWKGSLILKTTGTQVVAHFDNISGLLEGADVRYRGFKVGKVIQIIPKKDEILVLFRVKNGTQIQQGSVARVVFDGLVGEKFIAIRPAEDPNAPILKEGDSVRGYASSGLADAVEVTVANLNHTEAILRGFKDTLTDKRVMASFRETILLVESTVANVNKLTGQINTNGIGQFTQTMKRLDALTANLQSITQTIQTGVVTPQNAQDIQTIIRNLAAFTEQLKPNSPDAKSSSSGSSAVFLAKSIAKIRVAPDLGLDYQVPNQRVAYSANLQAKLDNQFVRAGISDRFGQTELSNIQYGVDLSNQWTGRAGAFYAKPGVGVDFRPVSGLEVSVDAYDVNKLQLDLTGKTAITPKVDLFMNVRTNRNSPATTFDQWGGGITIKP